MEKVLKNFVFGMCLIMMSAFAFAEPHASKDDAVKMVKNAVAFYKANGKDKAAEAFSDQTGKFRDRELFVVLMDDKGNVLGHGGMKKMIGANIMNLKDADGVLMVQDMYSKAKKDGDSGWSVPYKWLNPAAQKMEMKVTYFERVDNKIIFCGVYSS